MADQFTPDVVWNLISSSPQGRAFVENLAKLSQVQQMAQQVQQYMPQVQQAIQNPVQALTQVGNWAQAQQALPQETPQTQEAPKGESMNNNGGMMSMAMEVIGKFENALTEIYKAIGELDAKVTTLSDDMAKTNEDLRKLVDSLK